MDLTHLDLADAAADVSTGACARASWSTGGRVETLERTPRGIVHRVFNRRGECIAVSVLSTTEATAYARRRSAA